MKPSAFPTGCLAAALSLAALLRLSAAEAVHPAGKATGPLSPREALASIQVEPGLKVELVAAEPLVGDPVAIAWDERGRMYVAEDRGYPVGPGEGKPPAGVIALLEDTDGDGIYDKRTEFATGLRFPNGIMCWRGGVFVTDSPDILYLKDTDGDGKADVRKVVLTGYMTNSTTQLRVSHPTLGLDGWVYVTAGLTGGSLVSPEHPERPVVKFTRNDSRFNPDTFEVEPEPGAGQFGLAFDDFGRRFVCSNRNPLQHVVLHPRYLKRNPFLAFSDTVQDVAPPGDAAKVWPISEDQTTASFMPSLMSTPHAGTFTSACGISIYRGNALPTAMYGSAFICEPAQNLVQRQVIEPDGPTFKSHPATPGRDCVATKDSWFRPVFTANGPDGALYICDMYRKVIDHPQYLPEHIRGSMDFEAGKGMGRIYRLTAVENPKSKAQSLKLDGAKTKELVKALNDGKGWVRDTAFRLLLERKDKAAVPELKSQIEDYKSTRPAARSASLWLVQHLAGEDLLWGQTLVYPQLLDPDPDVREQSIRIKEINPNLGFMLKGLGEPLIQKFNSRERFVASLAIGYVEQEKLRVNQLTLVAAEGVSNRWARAALLSSLGKDPSEFVYSLLSYSPDARGGFVSTPALWEDLGQLLAAALPPDQLRAVLTRGLTVQRAADASWQVAFVTGIANAARARGLAKGDRSALLTLVAGDLSESTSLTRLNELFAGAQKKAAGASVPTIERVAAIDLLAFADAASTRPVLEKLIGLQVPNEVQAAAVRALAQQSDASVGAWFVERERWRAYTPPVRDAVLNAMLAQPRFQVALLEAVERGTVQPWAVPANRRTPLLKHKDAAIRDRAEKAFQPQGAADRMKVYEDYKAVLKSKGDAKSGHAVFTRTCVGCHRYNGEGMQVGPDLTGVRLQPAEALLLHIIVPDAEIYPGFVSYEVELKDGRTLTGLLASETATSVTLRAAQGVEETILRTNIAKMSSTSTSLMPQELEKTMTRQEMADLIAFLKGE